MTKISADRRSFAIVGGVAALLAIAALAIGADPSAKPEPPGQTKHEKAPKGPEIARTLTGKVEQTTDEKGRPTFAMTVDGVAWELSAGPTWFWGDKNPLAKFVGDSVEVTGTYHKGQTDLDVQTVNGKALRVEGKPPWAGGPKVVGERHPGWKSWQLDGKPGNGHGRENAPGQTKDKTGDIGG